MENVAAEWPYDKVLQLIALFQQRPVLWDTKCNDYKDRQKRHEATVELAERFHVEKDEIERKLKNLQSHFYREVKKEEQSKSLSATGITAAYHSKWFAYQAMRFLANKSKLRRGRAAAGNKTPAWRRKSTVTDVARMSTSKVEDKSRRCVVLATRLKKSDIQTRISPLQSSPVKAIKDKKIAYTSNGAAYNDFLYDANQQNRTDDGQIDCWDEKPISLGSQDPLEFPKKANDKAQQSQNIVSFEDTRTNERPSSSSFSNACKRDYKVISEDVIAPAIDFLLAEAKAQDLSHPELSFYRSLIPDIMKLSVRRRRQFKEMVLHTLNKLLDEDESDALPSVKYQVDRVESISRVSANAISTRD